MIEEKGDVFETMGIKEPSQGLDSVESKDEEVPHGGVYNTSRDSMVNPLL